VEGDRENGWRVCGERTSIKKTVSQMGGEQNVQVKGDGSGLGKGGGKESGTHQKEVSLQDAPGKKEKWLKNEVKGKEGFFRPLRNGKTILRKGKQGLKGRGGNEISILTRKKGPAAAPSVKV